MPTQLTEFGEILWHRPDLKGKLRDIARYNMFYSTYVTSPATLRLAEAALSFANCYKIEIKTNEAWRMHLDSPQDLMEYYNIKMFELSNAPENHVRLPNPLKEDVSQATIAGIRYAIHTQRCIIADPAADDRMAVALGAIVQKDCYPCILVCNSAKKEHWRHKIQSLFPYDVQMTEITQINKNTPWRSILLTDLTWLEKNFKDPDIPQAERIPRTSLIVDEAHLFKNPETHRYINLRMLSRKAPCRYLLTDYPVDLSYRDLGMLVQLLGRDREFEDLYTLLRIASRDPLESISQHGYNYIHQDFLRKLHFKLRATCMVRRGDDRNRNIQEKTVDIGLSHYFPDEIDPTTIKHPMHVIGIKKIESSVRWLRRFLQERQGKTLIFAHHNIVIRSVADALGIPTYYGKTVSKRERSRVIQGFQKDQNLNTIIVANDMDIEWDVSNVFQVVFVEMPRSLRKYDDLLNNISRGCAEKPVSVYFFVSNNSLDRRARYRLQVREQEYNAIMDGDITE